MAIKRTKLSTLRHLTMLVVLILWSGAKGVTAQVATENVTVTLDDSRHLTPEEAEESDERQYNALGVIFAPSLAAQVVSQSRTKIRQFLNADDRSLEKATFIKIANSDDPNAGASFGLNDTKFITINSGLYRFLDLLVASEVTSRKFHSPACGKSYLSYLMTSIQNQLMARQRGGIVLILEPALFAKRHLDICPNISVEDTAYNKADDKWSTEYQAAIHASMMFTILHELAHLKHGDPPVSTALPRRFPKTLEEQRNEESAADEYALDFLVSQKLNPLIALPLMTLLAGRENFSTTQDPRNNHPVTLERIKAMYTTTLSFMRSEEYQAWLKAQGPDSLHDSDQFRDFLNQQLLYEDQEGVPTGATKP
jgi:hypothetical protein